MPVHIQCAPIYNLTINNQAYKLLTFVTAYPVVSAAHTNITINFNLVQVDLIAERTKIILQHLVQQLSFLTPRIHQPTIVTKRYCDAINPFPPR